MENQTDFYNDENLHLLVDKIMAISKKPDGNERCVSEMLWFGVGKDIYAERSELEKAGLAYDNSPNSLFGYLKNKKDVRKFVDFISNNSDAVVLYN